MIYTSLSTSLGFKVGNDFLDLSLDGGILGNPAGYPV